MAIVKQGQIVLGAPKKGRGRFRGVLAAAAVLLAGAAIPHLLARALPRPGPAPADAIFVLTGGDGRIEEAYKAWRDGKARDLYIIGTKEGVRLEDILPRRHVAESGDRERIHLERWSENTLENAFSVKSVVGEVGVRSLILVTSDYHLPRAHFAVRQVVPSGIPIAVMSVPSDWRSRKGFLRALRRHFLEGWKYWGYRLFLLGE